MNTQRASYLDRLTWSMSPDQQETMIQILMDIDLAFRLKGTTVQKEIKLHRDNHTGKIKRLLTALAKHPDTIYGIDWIFEQKQKEGMLHDCTN